jgi:hypothetical protein
MIKSFNHLVATTKSTEALRHFIDDDTIAMYRMSCQQLQERFSDPLQSTSTLQKFAMLPQSKDNTIRLTSPVLFWVLALTLEFNHTLNDFARNQLDQTIPNHLWAASIDSDVVFEFTYKPYMDMVSQGCSILLTHLSQFDQETMDKLLSYRRTLPRQLIGQLLLCQSLDEVCELVATIASHLQHSFCPNQQSLVELQLFISLSRLPQFVKRTTTATVI